MPPGDVLEMFTVYSDPSDFPGKHVVRRSLIGREGAVMDAEPWLVTETLEEARAGLLKTRRGLFMQPRHPCDDPVIVEVWF